MPCRRVRPALLPATIMNMRLSFPIVLLTLVAVILGCAVTKVPVATGGSRADGTVQLAFEYGGFESPQVDLGSAHITAAQRCRAWGYTDAEPFGGTVSHCQAANEYGCLRFLVTMTYQCTGPQ